MSNLNHRQFKKYTLEYDKGRESHLITASNDEWGGLGTLDWNRKGGEINYIEVHEDHQRKGLATAMYNYANDLSKARKSIAKPVHSKSLTDEGEKWKKSLK